MSKQLEAADDTLASNPARTDLRKYVPLLIVAAGLLAYSNSFSGPFVFDDSRSIEFNQRVRDFSARQTVRPVVHLSFALNYALGGLNPADYHATNLLIHLCAGLALFGLVRRTLALPRMSAGLRDRAQGLAVAVAVLWTVHPLQTQSVTYIVQRTESLMGLFYLLTLYCVVRGNTSDRPTGWYFAAAACNALGMATKQVMVTAPLLVLLYDWIFLSKPGARPLLHRRRGVYVWLAGGWILLWALYRYNEQSPDSAATEAGIVITGAQYLATQVGVLTHYLRLSVWPHPLCLDYAWPLATSFTATIGPAAFIVALGILTVWALRAHPRIGFLGAAAFIVLGPTSSILPLADAAFEHRMYLPLAPLVVLAVLAGERMCRWIESQILRAHIWPLRALVTGALAMILMALTFVRNIDYHSAESMWLDVVGKQPDNVRAWLNLSSELHAAGEYESVIDACRRVLEKLPDYESIDRAELLRRLDEGGSRDFFYHAMVYSGVRNNLGRAYFELGAYGVAQAHFRESIRVAAGNLRARQNLAASLFKMGDTDAAMGEWNRVLAQEPDNAAAHASLADALIELGDFDTAYTHYETALRNAIRITPVKQRYAWLLATSPVAARRNGPRALELALQACDETAYLSPRAVDTLAAAYAEIGDFSKARIYAAEALNLATTTTGLIRDDLVGGIVARIALYELGRPYRDRTGEQPDE